MAHLIQFEWLLSGLRTANRQQRFRVRGHREFFASRCMSGLELSISLTFYPGTAQNFGISSTLLFKAHLALKRLDAELISFETISSMMTQYTSIFLR